MQKSAHTNSKQAVPNASHDHCRCDCQLVIMPFLRINTYLVLRTNVTTHTLARYKPGRLPVNPHKRYREAPFLWPTPLNQRSILIRYMYTSLSPPEQTTWWVLYRRDNMQKDPTHAQLHSMEPRAARPGDDFPYTRESAQRVAQTSNSGTSRRLLSKSSIYSWQTCLHDIDRKAKEGDDKRKKKLHPHNRTQP